LKKQGDVSVSFAYDVWGSLWKNELSTPFKDQEMTPKFVQIAIAPPKPDTTYFVVIGLDTEGNVWKGRVAGTNTELVEGWQPLTEPR